MKKNHLVLTACAFLFSTLIPGFTTADPPVVGYVKIKGQKTGQLKGNTGNPEWDITITSFTSTDADKVHNTKALIKFKKHIDDVSGEIENCFKENENLPLVEFELFNTKGKKQVFYEKITLSNASITQISQNAPDETISLQFQKIETQTL